MDKLTGTVLWFDLRDGNGIVKDAAGNEYYIDVSVMDDRAQAAVQAAYMGGPRTVRLQFERNKDIAHVSCAKNVRLI